ncbi:TPA: retron Ec78 anti-phage system effector HNH endonuclease PtuB [Serratia fonticola]
MHLLTRGEAPGILSEFDHKTQDWDCVKSKQKDEIWVELVKMQGKRCAYCEAKIAKGTRHIEHFKRKGIHRELTFEWQNLFGSCMRADGCGFYKDEQKYNEIHLIKMDEDNPENYFVFLMSGKIKIKEDLSPQDKIRAEETLRVFNLSPDRSPLVHQRAEAIKAQRYLSEGMLKAMTELWEMEESDECLAVLKDTLVEHLDKIKGLPFETAIKHHFISYCSHIVDAE